MVCAIKEHFSFIFFLFFHGKYAFSLSNTKPTSPQSTAVPLKELSGPSCCQRGSLCSLELTNRHISLLWSSIYLSAIKAEIFRYVSFSFSSSAAMECKIGAEGPVQWNPGLLLSALNVLCSHRWKFPCYQAGNSLSLLLGSFWNPSKLKLLTKSDCLLWWFASLPQPVGFPSGSVGHYTFFQGSKRGDSFLLFCLLLNQVLPHGFTSCFHRLLHRACQKGFKLWVNCQGGSAIYTSLSSRAPGLE